MNDSSSQTQKLPSLLRSPFGIFALLYAALYIAYGAESPFLPAFMVNRGVEEEHLGYVLAAGTLIRLLAGPAAGYLADRLSAARSILAISALGAGLVSFVYLGTRGLYAVLTVSIVHAIFTAPLAPFADALSVSEASRTQAFSYGWVRGVGSAAFVVGTLLSGQLVDRMGLSSIIVSSALMFMAMSAIAAKLPATPYGMMVERSADGLLVDLKRLFNESIFRRTVVIAALIIGSHAINDTFAVIRWQAAGLSSQTSSLLWVAAVLSEMSMFFFFGRTLIDRFGPGNCAVTACVAGILRWAIMAETLSVPFLLSAQLMHGLTFALLHLAAMRFITDVVPANLAATAQTCYGSIGLGLASMLLTASSGPLFSRFGAEAYWFMAVLCAFALPAAVSLRRAATA